MGILVWNNNLQRNDTKIMKSTIALLFVSLTIVVAEDFWQHVLQKRSCGERGGECHVAKHCCGDDQCYYENGRNMNPAQKGVCVECVAQNKKCQFDRNCCDGLQCDKTGDFNINGYCKPPRALGEECWEDSQCASGNCKEKWYQTKGVCV